MNFCLCSLFLLFAHPALIGNVAVEGLGNVELPPGRWVLNQSHISKAESKTPDVFLFHRAADPQERLTIVRYNSNIAPSKAVYVCDTVGDSSLFGIPFFLGRLKERMGSGEVHMLRKPKDWYANTIEVTYVYGDSNQTNWMSHAILSKQENAVFVCIHCAPRILIPTTVQDCFIASKFLINSPVK